MTLIELLKIISVVKQFIFIHPLNFNLYYFMFRIEVTEGGMKSVVDLAEGDMRKALNLLQSCSMAFPEVNPETAYMTLGHPTPEDILAILNWLLNDDFTVAFRSKYICLWSSSRIVLFCCFLAIFIFFFSSAHSLR